MFKTLTLAVTLLMYTQVSPMEGSLTAHIPRTLHDLPSSISTYMKKLPKIGDHQKATEGGDLLATHIVSFLVNFHDGQNDSPWQSSQPWRRSIIQYHKECH